MYQSNTDTHCSLENSTKLLLKQFQHLIKLSFPTIILKIQLKSNFSYKLEITEIDSML